MCVCYLPPETPTGVTDLLNLFDCLKAQTMEFHSYGNFFIRWDFNAKIT